MTTIFLHVGVTSFPDPGNWNPFDSIVDCVGSGGAGSVGSISTIPGGWQQRVLGGSGGGGTYARGQNLALPFPVPVSVAAANAGGSTWFNGNTNTPPNVWAPSGGNASGSTAGSGGAIGFPVSRAGGSASAALISNNQPNNPGLVWYGRAGGGGGAGGISGNGRFGSQYYRANGIGWGGSVGPSYGGASNATNQDQQPFPLDQTLISGVGTTDLSVWGDSVQGLGGGGNGGGEVFSSQQNPPQPGMAYFDGTTLFIYNTTNPPGAGWYPGGTNAGSLNGGNGGLYGGGGGGASLLYSGQSGVGGSGADGIIAITYTPYVPLPPGEPPPGWNRVFLDQTSGQQYWPDPGDWDPNNNKIECVGAGGPGGAGGSQGGDRSWGSGGGGGGAYAYATNVQLHFPVPYWIPPPASSTSGSNIAVNFNVLGNVPSTTPGSVSASNGAIGADGFGNTGQGGQNHFPNGFVGGNGGFTQLMFQAATGGGGGAAGPDGAGGNGSAQTSLPQGGTGGNSDGGLVSPGQSGQQWDVGRGTGGGAGGVANSMDIPGIAGAPYGGGGSGGGPLSSGDGGAAGGAGGPGMIILTWKPLPRPLGSSRFVVVR